MKTIALLFCLVLAASFAAAVPEANANGAPPVLPAILQQPANSIAATNEDIAFTVSAAGTPPLNYQWQVNGVALTGQTNSFLLLTNLATTQSGLYSVTVANAAGSVTSSNATLIVRAAIIRRLGTGRILQIDPNVGLPISFRSNGRESSVSFSLSYDTTVFSNPVFTAGDPTGLVTTDRSLPGDIGVAITLPPGRTFPAGYQWLGLIRFDLANGKSPTQAALGFTTNPIPIAAVNTSAQALGISASVLPEYATETPVPALDPQSGLFKQRLTVGNPGAIVMTNINILPLGLTFDSVSNAVKFFNAQAVQTNLPYGDPLIGVDCNCRCGLTSEPPCTFDDYLACGNNNCGVDFSSTNATFLYAQINNLLPGESRVLTIEFYVTDHLTPPAPQYSIFLADPFFGTVSPTSVVVMGIDSSRYLTNSFLIEFSTRLGHLYYVQYADTVEGLSTGRTVLPPVTGTGSRVQWIDDGPPKTASVPTNALRAYRLLTDQ